METKKPTPEEIKQIKINSRSRSIVFMAYVLAVRELRHVYAYDVVFKEKQLINDTFKCLSRLYKYYDEQQLSDLPFMDKFVEMLVEAAETNRQHIEKILNDGEKTDTLSQVQQESNSETVVE